jgi:malonyl-CoA/methylmalonyl-CoA synthetase
MPEKTASEFRPDGFFMTGDIGKLDDRGYLWILGRSKDIVITGGYNVYPKEVEIELDALPGVQESAVIGLPHPDLGEAVVAIVIPEAGGILQERAIIDGLRSKLTGYKLPKRVLVEKDLPRNTMGKIQKNVLRNRHAGLFRELDRGLPEPVGR